MEREFDAYKLSRCICHLTITVSEIERDICEKNRHHTPLAFDAPVRYGKTRMVSLPDGGKISKICLFVLTWSTNLTDGRTHRRTDTAWQQRPRLCIASRGKNYVMSIFKIADLSHLGFYGPIIGSLKSPCTTSYRSSIETMALNCSVVEKIAFSAFWRQTNRWTASMHWAALSVASGGLIRHIGVIC